MNMTFLLKYATSANQSVASWSNMSSASARLRCARAAVCLVLITARHDGVFGASLNMTHDRFYFGSETLIEPLSIIFKSRVSHESVPIAKLAMAFLRIMLIWLHNYIFYLQATLSFRQ